MAKLKYPDWYFWDILSWYPDGMPEDIIDVLASVWGADPLEVVEAFELAKKRQERRGR